MQDSQAVENGNAKTSKDILCASNGLKEDEVMSDGNIKQNGFHNNNK